MSGFRNRSPRCLAIVFLFLYFASSAFAGSDAVDTAGDVGRVLIPAAAAGVTLVRKDYDGTKQLVESLLAAAVVTQGLKAVVHERRPNGEGRSFPSGHASISFAGATFLQMRYGWEYGVPALLAAAFVGYSRVDADEHWTKDVVGGAAIGIASAWIFTSRYRKEQPKVFLVPVLGSKSAAITWNASF